MIEDRLIWLNKEMNALEKEFEAFKEEKMKERYGDMWLKIFQEDMGEEGDRVRKGFMDIVKEFKESHPGWGIGIKDVN